MRGTGAQPGIHLLAVNGVGCRARKGNCGCLHVSSVHSTFPCVMCTMNVQPSGCGFIEDWEYDKLTSTTQMFKRTNQLKVLPVFIGHFFQANLKPLIKDGLLKILLIMGRFNEVGLQNA